MKNHTKHLAAATLLVAMGVFAARVEAQNTVIQWSQLAGQFVAGAPQSQLRQHAMIHVAMADAVVAIEGRYEPFKVGLNGTAQRLRERGGCPSGSRCAVLVS